MGTPDMHDPEPSLDAQPVVDSTTGPASATAVADARPWRLRRPVLAGFALYGTLVAIVVGLGAWWLRERELGRQDALLTVVDAMAQFGVAHSDPARAIRTIEQDVLTKDPSDDVRRRALLLLATAYDAARRYDDSDRTYEAARRDWPAGLASGPLIVPWANMLVSAGKAARARELLAAAGATDGYGDDAKAIAEIDAVRTRVAKALEASGPK